MASPIFIKAYNAGYEKGKRQKCPSPSVEEMENRRWLAGMAINVLSNPNADREGIDSAKDMIYDLITKRGKLRMPEWETED
jgi:hypothetical protein